METAPDLDAFLRKLANPLSGLELWDHFADVVFFIKDPGGRYLAANRALLDRCQWARDAMIGRTARDVFPEPLGEAYWQQDAELIASGQPLVDHLEVHRFPSGRAGWCLTTKLPLIDTDGCVIGLMGMSRDVQTRHESLEDFEPIAQIVRRIDDRIDHGLRTADLAAQVGLSAWQLDQRMRQLFGMTTAQFLLQRRIRHATDLLATTERPIAEVALTCGYTDQSAFTRQFRQTTGLTPSQYRISKARR